MLRDGEKGGAGAHRGSSAFVEHDIEVRDLDGARVVVFSDGSGSALVKGTPTDGTIVRIQSACQYGEIYGSVECDCRDQLDHALQTLGAEPDGVLIHLLNQEGRGAGLLTKAKAYRTMREDEIDTFAAYKKFGVEADSRDYRAAAELLGDYLGLRTVRLMTNNPRKLAGLRARGVCAERVPIVKLRSGRCTDYFSSKLRNGHLDLDQIECIAD